MEREAPSASGPSVTASSSPSASGDSFAVPGPDALRALAQMLDEPDTQPERDFHAPPLRECEWEVFTEVFVHAVARRAEDEVNINRLPTVSDKP